MSEVLYLCNTKKCNNCSYPACKHTRDLKHAANFEHYTKDGFDLYIEKGKAEREQDCQYPDELRSAGLKYEHDGSPIAKVEKVDLDNGIIELKK